MNKLKPCPFCGEKVWIKISTDCPPWYGIEHDCKYKKISIILNWERTEDEVIKIWNERIIE